MGPEPARQLYETFLDKVRASYVPDRVFDGVFGAEMEVNICNDGPVTIYLESEGEGQRCPFSHRACLDPFFFLFCLLVIRHATRFQTREGTAKAIQGTESTRQRESQSRRCRRGEIRRTIEHS